MASSKQKKTKTSIYHQETSTGNSGSRLPIVCGVLICLACFLFYNFKNHSGPFERQQIPQQALSNNNSKQQDVTKSEPINVTKELDTPQKQAKEPYEGVNYKATTPEEFKKNYVRIDVDGDKETTFSCDGYSMYLTCVSKEKANSQVTTQQSIVSDIIKNGLSNTSQKQCYASYYELVTKNPMLLESACKKYIKTE